MTDNEALLTGATFGTLAKAGLMVEPVFDAEDNYTDTVMLRLEEPFEGYTVLLKVGFPE
jgi:hypothetical protein